MKKFLLFILLSPFILKAQTIDIDTIGGKPYLINIDTLENNEIQVTYIPVLDPYSELTLKINEANERLTQIGIEIGVLETEKIYKTSELEQYQYLRSQLSPQGLINNKKGKPTSKKK